MTRVLSLKHEHNHQPKEDELIQHHHHDAASSSKASENVKQEVRLDAPMEDEQLTDVSPSGAGAESIEIKQEPNIKAEANLEQWTVHSPVEVLLECGKNSLSGKSVPLELEDDDLEYFKSLIPYLTKLTPELKNVFRIKARNMLEELTT
ncbi:hypothetical protein GE061_014698 [Apolygus lucorum]|uniref:BESS domain-containing protein n=1 Tax=Apolygus lucorum TaxID=248454 RepID=A0A8S9XMZ1_APOLU|nr:hypothetical protein GE061_014698 [Apolygus lucorum]